MKKKEQVSACNTSRRRPSFELLGCSRKNTWTLIGETGRRGGKKETSRARRRGLAVIAFWGGGEKLRTREQQGGANAIQGEKTSHQKFPGDCVYPGKMGRLNSGGKRGYKQG